MSRPWWRTVNEDVLRTKPFPTLLSSDGVNDLTIYCYSKSGPPPGLRFEGKGVGGIGTCSPEDLPMRTRPGTDGSRPSSVTELSRTEVSRGQTWSEGPFGVGLGADLFV